MFYPHIPKRLHERLGETLKSKWIGQGPLVDKVHDKNRVIFDKRKKNDKNLFIENDVEV